MFRPAIALAGALSLAACGASTPAGGSAAVGESAASGATDSETKESSPQSKSGASPKQPKTDPLFPSRKVGWKAVDAKARKPLRALADDYLKFIARATTPRRAITALTDIARASGAVEMSFADRTASGGFYFAVARGATAAVFVRPGSLPVTEGLQVVVVSIDAPRIVLKQTPVHERHGFAVLQTKLHGGIDLASWMVHPLALYIYADRGANNKPVDVAIGTAPGDPVFSIPDVLPHLSSGVQSRRRPVKDAERLDALAARTNAALVEGLRARGIDIASLSAAEAYLIPSAKPAYVGVDRGLVGAYGQSRRALAFAAVRALTDAKPDRAIAVIAIDRSESDGTGSTGDGFVTRALSAIIASLAPDADVYDAQRSLSKTRVVVATPTDKGRNSGVLLNPRSADSLPRMVAAATRALDTDKVQYRVDSGRIRSPSRSFATLDLDAIDMSIAVTGSGTPGELLSVLDLYQGFLACRAWLSHSR